MSSEAAVCRRACSSRPEQRRRRQNRQQPGACGSVAASPAQDDSAERADDDHPGPRPSVDEDSDRGRSAGNAPDSCRVNALDIGASADQQPGPEQHGDDDQQSQAPRRCEFGAQSRLRDQEREQDNYDVEERRRVCRRVSQGHRDAGSDHPRGRVPAVTGPDDKPRCERHEQDRHERRRWQMPRRAASARVLRTRQLQRGQRAHRRDVGWHPRAARSRRA